METIKNEEVSIPQRVIDHIRNNALYGNYYGRASVLPRIHPQTIIDTMVFPFIIIEDEGVAKDRFGDIPFNEINTMAPENGKFKYYLTVFIQKNDYEKAFELVIFVAEQMKLSVESDNVLLAIEDHYQEKFDSVFAETKESGVYLGKAWTTMRTIVNEEIGSILEAKESDQKYKNLALGMIRYAVGMQIHDLNSD